MTAGAPLLRAVPEIHDLGHTAEDFRAAVVRGLSGSPKSIPSIFFYDERGSALFEQICELDEYYPTRTEVALLEGAREAIASWVGPDATIIEFGAGAAVKIRILLDAVRPRAFVPIDISRAHLVTAARALAHDYPSVRVVALCADFAREIELPASVPGERRVGFFPGSTIGNFRPDAAVEFMARVRRLVGAGGGLVIGVDLDKDERTLLAAYDDRAGVTAAFNRNLLARINRELGGDFDPQAFRHHAPWNAARGCIEMHLVSERRQSATIGAHRFEFAAGESIHTEDSHKYDVASFEALAREAGFEPEVCIVDAERLFSLHLLRA